jgi:peptide-methionine (R)-S-oxide reductase
MSEEQILNRSEAEWKKELSAEEYHILREAGTEAPFTGEYWDTHKDGRYRCRACGAELFSAETKFDSGSGWPSFTEPMNRQHVELVEDLSQGMRRTEVKCRLCGSHLGHVFPDGPTGTRYCINSACLRFEPSHN